MLYVPVPCCISLLLIVTGIRVAPSCISVSVSFLPNGTQPAPEVRADFCSNNVAAQQRIHVRIHRCTRASFVLILDLVQLLTGMSWRSICLQYLPAHQYLVSLFRRFFFLFSRCLAGHFFEKLS